MFEGRGDECGTIVWVEGQNVLGLSTILLTRVLYHALGGVRGVSVTMIFVHVRKSESVQVLRLAI